MKEKLEEIFEGLKERLKSSFLLTFIIVWLIHHWAFVYILFSFTGEISGWIRLGILADYIDARSTTQLFWEPVRWTFLSLLLYYSASFLAEGINLLYSKWARAFLYLKLDSNKLKTVEDYNEMDQRRKNLQDLVHDLTKREEEAVLKLKTREQEFYTELGRLEGDIGVQQQQINQFNTDVARKDIEIGKLNDELTASKRYESHSNDYTNFKTWLRISHPEVLKDWNIILDSEKAKRLIGDAAIHKLFEIMKGDWRLTYRLNRKTGTERVKVDQNGEYIANGNHLYNLTDVVIDLNTNDIKLTKTHLDGNMHSWETLKIQNNSLITGVDNLGYTLEYTKLSNMPEVAFI